VVKIIALFNQSGGVGKTTLTVNLGYHLAEMKRRVLLIDLDPQASLTVFMGLDPEDLKDTIYDAVVGEKPMPVLPQIHKMDLTPSNINLCTAEMELISVIMREQRLKQSLEPLEGEYDYILIDCPPSLGILTVLALVAATDVLVPVQCQFKSFQGTDLLLNTVAKLRRSANSNLRLAGFIPTMFDARTAQETRTYEALKEQLSPLAPVYEPIPRTIAFADASEARLPLALAKSKHPALKILKNIALELDKNREH
jgi:chromosome partitioning protein